jgi:hypothetical protein
VKIRLSSKNIGVFFVEIIWGALFFVGIEKVNIGVEFTKYNDPHLVYMPYSHALADYIFWCDLIWAVFRQENSGQRLNDQVKTT